MGNVRKPTKDEILDDHRQVLVDAVKRVYREQGVILTPQELSLISLTAATQASKN